ncbi:hypothetical protein N9Y07_03330 [Alphaproteobacteria bacterium]|nr:hypothetical protein [Alphaproteobacteria bacterium]
MLSSYKKILSKRRIVPILLTLEIIEKLYNRDLNEVAYGMTELYESLLHPKPTFSSFRNQISALELAGCIIVQTSKEKASKKSVYLTEDFRIELQRDVYE